MSLESDDYNESEEAVTTEQDGEKKKKPKNSLSFTRLLSADARLESAVSHDCTTLIGDRAVNFQLSTLAIELIHFFA